MNNNNNKLDRIKRPQRGSSAIARSLACLDGFCRLASAAQSSRAHFEYESAALVCDSRLVAIVVVATAAAAVVVVVVVAAQQPQRCARRSEAWKSGH